MAIQIKTGKLFDTKNYELLPWEIVKLSPSMTGFGDTTAYVMTDLFLG